MTGSSSMAASFPLAVDNIERNGRIVTGRSPCSPYSPL
jgi:hypothetical protein